MEGYRGVLYTKKGKKRRDKERKGKGGIFGTVENEANYVQQSGIRADDLFDESDFVC